MLVAMVTTCILLIFEKKEDIFYSLHSLVIYVKRV